MHEINTEYGVKSTENTKYIFGILQLLHRTPMKRSSPSFMLK